MQTRLVRYPETPCAADIAIEVGISRPMGSMLGLRFSLTGDLDALVIPARVDSRRADELWKHTCFEAFLRGPRGGALGEAYAEFNFAPSTRWAAYRFDGYRAGMAPLNFAFTPMLTSTRTAGQLEVRTMLDLGGVDLLPETATWTAGVTAVIEEVGGRISYWAAAHAPTRPDFHHSDGFAIELAAVSGA